MTHDSGLKSEGEIVMNKTGLGVVEGETFLTEQIKDVRALGRKETQHLWRN